MALDSMSSGTKKVLFIGGVTAAFVAVVAGGVFALVMYSNAYNGGAAAEPPAATQPATEATGEGGDVGGGAGPGDIPVDVGQPETTDDPDANQPMGGEDPVDEPVVIDAVELPGEGLEELDGEERLSLSRYVAAWLEANGTTPENATIEVSSLEKDQQGVSVRLIVKETGAHLLCTYDPFTNAWAVATD